MAPRTKAAKPESASDELEDWAQKLLDKEPSETHERFVDYVKDTMGYDVDLKTVQIVISQYQKFQKTPKHQEFLAGKREASAEAKAERDRNREARANKSAEAPEKRASSRRAAAAEEEAEEATPARGRTAARKSAAKAAPSAARRSSRRRPSAEEELD